MVAAGGGGQNLMSQRTLASRWTDLSQSGGEWLTGGASRRRLRSSLVWLERPERTPWYSRWTRWSQRMAEAARQWEALTAEEDGDRFELVVGEAVQGVGEVLDDATELREEEMALLLDRRRLPMVRSSRPRMQTAPGGSEWF
jgi:hypothetical protein